jgi:hypothetical protein
MSGQKVFKACFCWPQITDLNCCVLVELLLLAVVVLTSILCGVFISDVFRDFFLEYFKH